MTSFESLFGRAAGVVAQAPGRVNLIGEHTDYTGGFVLPTAIPRHTRVEIATRDDRRVGAWSENTGDAEPVTYELGAETPAHAWYDYLAGATKILTEAGFALRGFDIRIASSVPLGAGLSSSASFGVAVMRGLREAFVGVAPAAAGSWGILRTQTRPRQRGLGASCVPRRR